MNSSITLDYLISQSSGNTLVFGCCPNSLLKEAILRGFQVSSDSIFDRYGFGCGITAGFVPELGGGYSSGGGHCFNREGNGTGKEAKVINLPNDFSKVGDYVLL